MQKENAASISVNSSVAESVDQHSLPLSIALHLLPGIGIGAVFFTLAPQIDLMGWPSFTALIIADLLVLVPWALGLMVMEGKRKTGRCTLQGVILYHTPLAWWQYVILPLLLFLAAAILMTAMAPVSRLLLQTFFSWIPEMYHAIPDLTAYDQNVLITSYIAYFVVICIVAPIIEEFYFRGYLLPRLSRFGGWAPIITSALFALFHTWSPWLSIARFVGILPLIIVVQRKRNIKIAIVAHILANSVDLVAAMITLSQISSGN